MARHRHFSPSSIKSTTPNTSGSVVLPTKTIQGMPALAGCECVIREVLPLLRKTNISVTRTVVSGRAWRSWRLASARGLRQQCQQSNTKVEPPPPPVREADARLFQKPNKNNVLLVVSFPAHILRHVLTPRRLTQSCQSTRDGSTELALRWVNREHDEAT